MKRFYASLIFLIIIISSAIYLNNEIISKTSELSELVKQNKSSNEIILWWDKNDIWFKTLLPEDLNQSLYSNIIELNNDSEARKNIYTDTIKIIDSLKVSFKNIF